MADVPPSSKRKQQWIRTLQPNPSGPEPPPWQNHEGLKHLDLPSFMKKATAGQARHRESCNYFFSSNRRSTSSLPVMQSDNTAVLVVMKQRKEKSENHGDPGVTPPNQSVSAALLLLSRCFLAGGSRSSRRQHVVSTPKRSPADSSSFSLQA